MAQGRIMDQPEDYKKLGINPNKIEAWEDGRRDNDKAGHAEVWYLDCSFDDKSTLVLGFRPKLLIGWIKMATTRTLQSTIRMQMAVLSMIIGFTMWLILRPAQMALT